MDNLYTKINKLYKKIEQKGGNKKRFKLIEMDSKNVKNNKIYIGEYPIDVAKEIYSKLCKKNNKQNKKMFLLINIDTEQIYGPYIGECMKDKFIIKKINQNGGWSFYTKK